MSSFLDVFVNPSSPVQAAVLSSLVAGTLATLAGALPIVALRQPSQRATDRLLSYSAGVMLAACFFSLLSPAMATLPTGGLDALEPALELAFAFAAGGALVWSLNRLAPHEHFIRGVQGPRRARVSRVWLFVMAIALHNLPEGLATGVGSGSGDLLVALPILAGIGLQNLPEGLAVAAGLAHAGYGRRAAFAMATLTGLVEPVGAVVGALAITASAAMLPLSLAFAAGAMVWVVSGEVIPETHREGAESEATGWLLGGFATMMVLDAVIA